MPGGPFHAPLRSPRPPARSRLPVRCHAPRCRRRAAFAGHARADPRWLAYLLATAWHETARTMQPIHEFGSAAYFNLRYSPPPAGRSAALAAGLGNVEQDDGDRFHGRGFVQLTGRRNYADWSARLGLDLIAEPDRCLEPAIAARILIEGAVLGTFTGRRLGDYLGSGREDWTGARRVINGLDRAAAIADLARRFHGGLRPGR
ncbi:MAG TPA: hypothetical protein PKE25_13965 [Novosphingobium sp.]|nr:hypothetical protein [Novosphingobium sp.]